MRGTVVSVNREKRYGFIESDADRRRVYVRDVDGAADGFTVVIGQRVEFTLTEGTYGPIAKDVTVLDTLPADHAATDLTDACRRG